MRALILSLALVLLAGQAMATDPEIVIYDSWAFAYGNAVPARDAAQYVTTNWKAYGAGEEAQWIADVNDGADIVVFDVCSNYTGSPGGQVPQLASVQLDAMYQFLTTHPDACGILALWFMAYESSPIFGYFGVQWCSDIWPDPLPLYQWSAGDCIWNGIPNPVRNQEVGWWVDGSMVSPTGSASAIGGFTPSSTSCQAGLVVSNGYHTFYIGETGAGGFPDDDLDGIRDWTELYVNIYHACGGGPTATEPSTWGSVKDLYR